ncbi:MAG: TIM barrel protein [Puniceicoccales bacterium]|jgi:hydroxypyruvate isomerase|nr:TIM barrel protein [Puniceicoccales bacterium]
MNRRQAIKAVAATGALTAISRFVPAVLAQENPAVATTPASNSFRHSVTGGYYRKIPLEKFALEAKKMGIESIELLNPADWPKVQQHGLICAVSTGPSTISNGFNRRENHAKYVPAYIERIKECANGGVPNVICFSGNRNGQSDEEGLEICAEGLKQIMPAAEKAKVTVIMELLNSKVNHKDYQCDRTAWGVELAKRIGSERFKLLYDIYHMQVMEGDVIRTIRENAAYIGHYHTAGNPGRNEFEPTDEQELNYPAIMRAIHKTGFRGFVGQEFGPRRDPLTSLAAAIKICTV